MEKEFKLSDEEFIKGQPDEDAMAETRENFGEIEKEECDIVCDDCYEKMFPHFPEARGFDGEFKLSDEEFDVTGNGIIWFRKDNVKEFIRRLKKDFCKKLPRKSNEYCNKCYYCKEIDNLSGDLG